MESAQPPRLEEAPARLRDKGSWLISKTGLQAHRLIADAMAAVQGRTYHFAILATLEEFGSASQVMIGQRCGIDRSDMHAMVNELAGQDLVVRAPDPDDKRRNLITLTPAGRRRLDELDAVLTQVQDELFDVLSAAEREQLIGLLTRVLAKDSVLAKNSVLAKDSVLATNRTLRLRAARAGNPSPPPARSR